MKPQTFDNLTRALAAPTSRRSALGRIAGLFGLGTVGGGTLAALSPGLALAGGGNSNAAHFCSANFAPGPDRGQCVAAAAQGGGLFASCGGGTQSVCCPTNANGQCTSYSSATCCSSGQVCNNGTCVSACPAGTVPLSNGSCATTCASPGPCTGSGGSCSGTNGFGFPCGECARDNNVGNTLYCRSACDSSIGGPCASDSDCTQGYFCYIAGTCLPLC